MAGVYSTLFFLDDYDATDGPVELFTTQAGVVTVIREISGCVVDGGIGLALYILAPGSASYQIISMITDDSGGFLWQGRAVLNAGILLAIVDSLEEAHGSLIVSGYELALP